MVSDEKFGKLLMYSYKEMKKAVYKEDKDKDEIDQFNKDKMIKHFDRF